MSKVSGERKARGVLRVLVAEDDRVNQRLLVRLLEKRGHTAVAVRTGREAIAALEAGRFDLVLMDVQMPDMDGLEATAAIRAREQANGGQIAIIAVTAHADRARCLAAGMNDHLQKPVRAEDLFAAINRLARASRRGGARAPAAPGARQVFDLAAALDRVEGDTEMLSEVASIYLADCPRLLAAIQSAVARRDAPALEGAAHALKGAVSTFSASAARAAVFALEQMAKKGDLAGAPDALATLEREVDRLREALVESGLAGGPGS